MQQVFGAYGLSGRLGWRKCCQVPSAGPVMIFFHEGMALLVGKGAPGHWAELVRLQLPFPGIKDLSSSLCGKAEEQSLGEAVIGPEGMA